MTGWAGGVVAVGLIVLLCGWGMGVLLDRHRRPLARRDTVVVFAARCCGIVQGLGAVVAATAFVLWMAIAAF